MAWGRPQHSMTPKINTFQYVREINASNTRGYEVYLIPDS